MEPSECAHNNYCRDYSVFLNFLLIKSEYYTFKFEINFDFVYLAF